MLTGLTFANSARGPAIRVEGGQLLAEACRFEANPDSALLVTGGRVLVNSSVFRDNGGNSHERGGAIQAEGGHLDVASCQLDANAAREGGAIYMRNVRGCWIRNTRFTNNRAAEGGALYATNSSVTLANQSWLASSNEASGTDWPAQASSSVSGQGRGSGMFVSATAIVTYALPAPSGFWIANPVLVRFETRTCDSMNLRLPPPAAHCTALAAVQCRDASSLCDVQEHSGYTVWTIDAPFDGQMPYPCAPGVLGSSDEVEQASPLCGGACPAGKFCEAQQRNATVCPPGTYCPAGSPNAVPCERGTYNPTEGATSVQSCLECDEGFVCGLGQAEQQPCPLGEFCPRGTTASLSCSNQVVGSTTLGEGRGRNAADCVCKATFLMNGEPPPPDVNDTRTCTSCPSQGVDCDSEGVTLARLVLYDGFWRAHNLSTNVQPCFEPKRCVPRWHDNGTFTPCAPGNTGPYCQVCEPNFYRSLSDQTCHECDGSEAAAFAIPLVMLTLFVGALVYVCAKGEKTQLRTVIDTALNIAAEQNTEDGTATIQQVLEEEAQAKVEEAVEQAATDVVAAGQVAVTVVAGESRMSRLKDFWRRRGDEVLVKVRVLISLVQVLSALGVVFVIPYPPVYTDLVNWLGLFELDLIKVMPLSCSFDLNFHSRLLLRTLVPLGAIVLLSAISVAVGKRYEKRVEEVRESVRNSARVSGTEQAQRTTEGKALEVDDDGFGGWLAQKLVTAAFFLLFLIYPSVSQQIFATFQCFTIDGIAGDVRYLRADASIDCDSGAHRVMMAYAVVMMLVYPFGTPALYTYMLRWRHLRTLRNLRSIELLVVQHNEQRRALQRYVKWREEESEANEALHMMLRKSSSSSVESGGASSNEQT